MSAQAPLLAAPPAPDDHAADAVRLAMRWPHNGATYYRQVHRRYKHALMRGLGVLVAEGIQSNSPAAVTLRDTVDSSPLSALSRVVLAPAGAEVVMWSRKPLPERLEVLEGALRVERHRADATSSVNGPGWSLLGDYNIGGHRAQVVGESIPIDLVSPWRHVGDGLGASDPSSCAMAPEVVVKLCEKLNEAAVLTSAVCPAAALLARTFIRVLTVRLDPSTGFGSSSTLSYPGRVTLINPQDADPAPAVLMEALVHEATHNMIYELEATNFWAELNPKLTVTSPWSGAAIPLHAYTHACFVWFGLWNLWLFAIESRVVNDELAMNRLSRCAQGFAGQQALARLVPFRDRVHPAVLQACARMQAEVRATLGYGE